MKDIKVVMGSKSGPAVEARIDEVQTGFSETVSSGVMNDLPPDVLKAVRMIGNKLQWELGMKAPIDLEAKPADGKRENLLAGERLRLGKTRLELEDGGRQ